MTTESSLLGGKVRKRSLPVLDPPAGPEAPALKRLALPQGELAQVHDSEAGMRYLALIELRPGGVRGNHYHKRKEEWVYLIEGQVELTVEDIHAQSRASVLLGAGDLVWIGVEVAHAFRPLAPGSALEFSPQRYDPDDTYRVVLTS